MNGLKTAGIALAIGLVVQGITNLINAEKEREEERKARALEEAKNAIETSNQVDELMAKYEELSSSYLENGQISEEFSNTIYDLIDALGLEGETVDTLIQKYGNLDNAIRHADIEARNQRLATILGALDDEVDDVIGEAGGGRGNRAWSQEYGGEVSTSLRWYDYVNYLNENAGRDIKEINDEYYEMVMDSLKTGFDDSVRGEDFRDDADNLSIVLEGEGKYSVLVEIANEDTRDIPAGSYVWTLILVTDPEYDEHEQVIVGDRQDGVFPLYQGDEQPKFELKGVAYVI